MKDKQVKGYPRDKVRQKAELCLKTYEYDMPFNYANVTVWRKQLWGDEFHGVELAAVNERSPAAKLNGVTPGTWMRLQTVVTVPPETASAVFLVEVSGMAATECLWLAEARADLVDDEWQEPAEIPRAAVNLIANPSFAGNSMPPPGWKIDAPGGAGITGGFIPPAGWKTDLSGIGKITPAARADAGRAGLKMRAATLVLFTEFPVAPGQKLVYSIWVKSTNRSSRAVRLSPRWKNRQGLTVSDQAGDCIIIEEEHPIVRVAVLGSACTPPGFVALEAEPCDELYRRGDMVRGTAPLRFRQNNLWGMHLRIDQWRTMVPGKFGYEAIPDKFIQAVPFLKDGSVKSHYSEFPLAGMSCAIFEIPKSKKVTIMGGSDNALWLSDNCPDDNHYSFRMIRVTVAVPGEKRIGKADA